ncbi:FecR family protein [Chitinophaga sp. HK235]|uniref:FecR family protein n=1 Tax=Chitinophaga sp. HK235 TaxID=2952571 RepID=UPI001BA6B146|nr:FecR domain-containing protein [Chitinophaga sp. HK235]
MKEIDIPPPELIRKYLDGQCTEAEVLQIQQWYASFEGAADPLQELSAAEQTALGQRMLDRVLQQTDQAPVSRKHLKVLYRVLQAAAVVLVLWGAGYYWFSRDRSTPTGQLPMQAISNTSTNIRQYQLSDGTIVWLKPGARLLYADDFGSQHRRVSMTGEVFFDVATRPSLPFTVEAGGLTTRVLGTSFSVKMLGNRTEVTVITGKVAVEEPATKKTAAVLQPAQRITYDGSRIVRDSLTLAAPSIWEGSHLNFDNVKVYTIIQALNERFAVDIAVGDTALAHYFLKADFTGMHLAAILEMLEKSLDAHYEIKGNSIILEKNQTNSRDMKK